MRINMPINEPIEVSSPHVQKIWDLNQDKLIWEDSETQKKAEEIILVATPDKNILHKLEEKSVCQVDLDDKDPGSMPRWRRLVSLDAIARQSFLDNVNPLQIREIMFLDYRNEKQRENNDAQRAETVFNDDGTISIRIFYQQQFLTEDVDLFNAIDSAHEAKHFTQIVSGRLTKQDLPDIHGSYKKVNELSKKDNEHKVLQPSTLKWYKRYYGNKGLAHWAKVEAVVSSIEIAKTMDYLDLSLLDKSN